MNNIIFLDPTLSLCESDRTLDSDFQNPINEIPACRKFKSMWKNPQNDLEKKTSLIRKSANLNSLLPQKTDKIVSIALNGFFKKKITIRKEPQNSSADRLGCIINDTTPRGSTTHIDISMNPVESSLFKCTPPFKIFSRLSSLNISKSRSKSMPNVLMFENMKKSVYPALHIGDSDYPEILRKDKQRLSLKCLEFQKKLGNSSIYEEDIILPMTSESQEADDSRDERRITKGRSASQRLTVKVSQSSCYTLKHTGFLNQRYKDSKGSVGIDTIIDVESMLMKNEEFLRYLKDQRPQIPRVVFHTSTSKCLKSKPVVIKKADLLAFGHREKIAC